VGNYLFLSGLAAVIAVASFLPGSPFRYVDCVGELTPVVTGPPPAVVDHLGLHHGQGITEKSLCLST
jgi:hypothetical protein